MYINGVPYETHSIIVEPMYLYSSHPKFIFEHSAVFRIQSSSLIVDSDQNSFTGKKITIYLLNTTFNSLSTTENLNLIVFPVSYGGSTHYKSLTITLESYSNTTAKWWESELSSLGFTVNRVGRNVTITASNVDLSIEYLVVYATTSGSVSANYSLRPLKIVNLSDSQYTVYRGTTIPLGVRVVDRFYNPVRNVNVEISDTCGGTTTKTTDERGEVWYYFGASSSGVCDVTFSVPEDSFTYEITISSTSTGGIFDVSWNVTSFNWNVSLLGPQKNFKVSVYYGTDPVKGAVVDISTNSPSLVSYPESLTTDQNGEAIVTVTALNNGTAYLFATAGGSGDILELLITGAGVGYCPAGWSYWREITITNSGSALSDYQVKIELNSGNFDFSHAKSDGSDIRFYDSDRVTPLSYWIEEWDSGSEHAVVWVKVPEIPSGTKTIYMYYGNPSAGSESNGNDVFDFFDDFTSDTSSNYDVRENWFGSPTFVWEPSYSRIRTDTSNADYFLTTSPPLSTNFIVEIKAYTRDNDAVGALIEAAGRDFYIASMRVSDYDGTPYRGYSETLIKYDNIPSYWGQASRLVNFGDVVNPAYPNWQVCGIGYDGDNLYAYYNHQKQASGYAVGTLNIKSIGLSSQANYPYAYYDWILVRKYANPEPSASVGSEQTC